MESLQLFESCIVTGGMGFMLYHLNNKTDTDTDIALLGYMLCSLLLILLHQIAPLFHSNPVQKTESIYRSSPNQGLWCVFLIPAICVLSYYIRVNKSDTGNVLDIDLLCILLTVALTVVHYNPTNVSQISGALILLWLKEIFKAQDTHSLAVCTVYSIMYYVSLSRLPQLFPKCFTYGESTIVLQSTFLIVSKGVSFVTQGIPKEGEPYPYVEFTMLRISFLALLGIGISTVFLYILRKWNSVWKFYIVYCLVTASCVVFGLPKRNPVVVLIKYISSDFNRLYLLVWCLFLTSLTFVYLSCHDNRTSISTSTRKIFHSIIIAVYIPGFWIDTHFLLIASLLAFCVMLVVETVRYMDVAPFGRLVQEKYKLFVDKQDQGLLTLTPLYLLLGLSQPLWLSFILNIPVDHISIYAGILSVGIGDAAASVFGSRIGRLNWPGSKKTVEGTCASLVSQIITLYCLKYICGVRSAMTIYTSAAVSAATILEAVTTQIDNLVLPLFLYLLLIINVL